MKPLKLLVLLDEGVPAEVGNVFSRHGHEVIPFDDVLTPGSADELVCAAAEANNALLVAYDNDMKQYVRRRGAKAQIGLSAYISSSQLPGANGCQAARRSYEHD